MTFLMTQDRRTLLNLKRIRELNIIEQSKVSIKEGNIRDVVSIVALTDYGTEIRLAEYDSQSACEKAMMDLTKDIYQKGRLIFLMPEGGWNDALY